jgi:DNA mismatch repair ATPase MutS
METIQVQFTSSQLQDIKQFCQLNDIEITELVKKCFKVGYNIEKYGLLGKTGEEQVEVPVEVIKYVDREVIKEIPVEVVKYVDVEIIKEIPVEKIVTIYDKSDDSELLLKIQQLEVENEKFSTKIQEMEEERIKFSTKIQEMENIFQNKPEVDDGKSKQLQQTIQTLIGRIREKETEINNLKEELKNCGKVTSEKPAVFLRNSNLGDNLYKE